MYSDELDCWIEARNRKIEQAVKNLNSRQDAEILNFSRKVQDSTDDLLKDRFLQEQGLNQKYENLLKEMKGSQER